MKKRFYLGLIFLAVLLLALAGLVARTGAAVSRRMAGLAVSATSIPLRGVDGASS